MLHLGLSFYAAALQNYLKTDILLW